MWNDDEVPPALRRHVHALRAEVPVRPAWRESVLRAVAAQRPAPRPAPRRWSVSPWLAVAAGLACAAVGAGATWWAAHRHAPTATVAASATRPTRADALVRDTVVRFALLAPGASHVTLVGDFNRWDPAATPLRASADGRLWEVRVPLSPGRHVYAFVVDGGVRADPGAPRTADDDFGTPSSVVLVAGAS